ncbi:MAG: aminoglycoside 6-adenylyltransferase [Brevinematales bacterium]|nr:aminoglycoside 6-adenylyltransferase [Brevinematales bacterium]
MRTEREMLDIITDTAREDERIHAVILCGSRADKNALHDKYSDFDIVYIVRYIQSFTESDAWLDRFGERLIMQKPADFYNRPYDYNGNQNFIYLMQFTDGNRIDLTLSDISNIQTWIENREPQTVLLDKDEIMGLHDRDTVDFFNIRKPPAEEFRDCCNEFWWLCPSVVKGLYRKELVYLKFIMERYQLGMLLKMLEWKAGIDNDFSVSAGKFDRYLTKLLNTSDRDRLTLVFPNGEFDDIKEKFIQLCHFFHDSAITVSEYFHFDYKIKEAENVMEYIRASL